VSKASPSIGATAMEEHQYTPEALEHCRRTTGTALSAAAERVSEASEGQSIVTSFDWEIPELTTPHLNTFLARIHCQAGERSFRIPIDVARLAAEGRTADLEKLLAILSARQAGLDGRHSLVGPSNGCWLSRWSRPNRNFLWPSGKLRCASCFSLKADAVGNHEQTR